MFPLLSPHDFFTFSLNYLGTFLKSSCTHTNLLTSTHRRAASMSLKGMHFVGMGVSGGEEGARTGPSLMVGGKEEVYNLLEPILSKCAAQVSLL